MESSYRIPITQKYEKRGCQVSIDAAANSNRVDIEVRNIKTGRFGKYSYVIDPIQAHERGYTMNDVQTIKSEIDSMLDTYGELEWNEIHFTNQILS